MKNNVRLKLLNEARDSSPGFHFPYNHHLKDADALPPESSRVAQLMTNRRIRADLDTAELVVTQSSIREFQACPYRYWLKQWMGVEEEATGAMTHGIKWHATIERWLSVGVWDSWVMVPAGDGEELHPALWYFREWYVANVSECKTEVTMSDDIWLGTDVVPNCAAFAEFIGTADMIVIDGEAKGIWDFKTLEETVRIYERMSLDPQLAGYRWLAERNSDKQIQEAASGKLGWIALNRKPIVEPKFNKNGSLSVVSCHCHPDTYRAAIDVHNAKHEPNDRHTDNLERLEDPGYWFLAVEKETVDVQGTINDIVATTRMMYSTLLSDRRPPRFSGSCRNCRVKTECIARI